VGTYASTLTIEELPGAGKTGRRLVLQGAGLPFMGAEWAFENNLTTTWYPGNGGDASQQNLGPRLLPSTWNGEWNRTRLSRSQVKFYDETGNESVIVLPMVLMEICESMFTQAYLLRVTWAVEGETRQDTAKIVREGRVKTARFPIQRHTDVSWTFEFHWKSRGGVKQVPTSTRDDSLATKMVALNLALNAAIGKIQGFSKLTRKQPAHSRLTLGQFEQLAKYPKKLADSLLRTATRATSQLKQLGDIVKTVRGTPFAIAGSAVNVARNTVAIANQFVDEMSRNPAELNSLNDDVKSLVRSTKQFNEQSDAMREVARRAHEFAKQFQTAVAQVPLQGNDGRRETSGGKGRIITVHLVRAGDTPQRLSVKYYGTPDYGAEICKANKLPWYQATLPIGRPVVIPVIESATSTTT